MQRSILKLICLLLAFHVCNDQAYAEPSSSAGACFVSPNFSPEGLFGFEHFQWYSGLIRVNCKDSCESICKNATYGGIAHEYSTYYAESDDVSACTCACLDYSGCQNNDDSVSAKVCAAKKTFFSCASDSRCDWLGNVCIQRRAYSPVVSVNPILTLDGGVACKAYVIPPASATNGPASDYSQIKSTTLQLESGDKSQVLASQTFIQPSKFEYDGGLSYISRFSPKIFKGDANTQCSASVDDGRSLATRQPPAKGTVCQCPSNFIWHLQGYAQSSEFNLIQSAFRTNQVCDECGFKLFKSATPEEVERYLLNSFFADRFGGNDSDLTDGFGSLSHLISGTYAPISACLQSAARVLPSSGNDSMSSNSSYLEEPAFDQSQVKAGLAEYYYTIMQLHMAKPLWEGQLESTKNLLNALKDPSIDNAYLNEMANALTQARALRHYRDLFNQAASSALLPLTWMSKATKQYVANRSIPVSDSGQLFSVDLFNFVCASAPTCTKDSIVAGLGSLSWKVNSIMEDLLAPYPWITYRQMHFGSIRNRVPSIQDDILYRSDNPVDGSEARRYLSAVQGQELLEAKQHLESRLKKLELVKHYLHCPTVEDGLAIGNLSSFINELPPLPLRRTSKKFAENEDDAKQIKLSLEVDHLFSLIRELRDAKLETVDVANDAIKESIIAIAWIVAGNPGTVASLPFSARAALSGLARTKFSLRQLTSAVNRKAAEKILETREWLQALRIAEGNAESDISLVRMAMAVQSVESIGASISGASALLFGYCDQFANFPVLFLQCRTAAVGGFVSGLTVFMYSGPGAPLHPAPALVIQGPGKVFVPAFKEKAWDMVRNSLGRLLDMAERRLVQEVESSAMMRGRKRPVTVITYGSGNVLSTDQAIVEALKPVKGSLEEPTIDLFSGPKTLMPNSFGVDPRLITGPGVAQKAEEYLARFPDNGLKSDAYITNPHLKICGQFELDIVKNAVRIALRKLPKGGRLIISGQPERNQFVSLSLFTSILKEAGDVTVVQLGNRITPVLHPSIPIDAKFSRADGTLISGYGMYSLVFIKR